MNNTLKIGDLIIHNTLGLMLLTEDLSDTDNPYSSKIHGQPLFKMIKFLSSSNNQWILYQSSLDESASYSKKVKKASAEDILSTTKSWFSHINLSKETSISLSPDDELFPLAIHGQDQTICLTADEIFKLKELLDKYL